MLAVKINLKNINLINQHFTKQLSFVEIKFTQNIHIIITDKHV